MPICPRFRHDSSSRACSVPVCRARSAIPREPSSAIASCIRHCMRARHSPKMDTPRTVTPRAWVSSQDSYTFRYERSPTHALTTVRARDERRMCARDHTRVWRTLTSSHYPSCIHLLHGDHGRIHRRRISLSLSVCVYVCVCSSFPYTPPRRDAMCSRA